MNKLKIIIFLVIISFVGIFMYKKQNNEYNVLEEDIIVSQNIINNTTEIPLQEKTTIKVHIAGEIKSPGVYELDENSRINDLIILAGGQTENANISKVNLAYKLSDGEKIYIPNLSEEISTYISSNAGENIIESENITSKSGKININKASIQDLTTISGIGPSLAQRIFDYRTENGKFNSIEDLKNVSGIGDKKFDTIKNFITIN